MMDSYLYCNVEIKCNFNIHYALQSTITVSSHGKAITHVDHV